MLWIRLLIIWAFFSLAYKVTTSHLTDSWILFSIYFQSDVTSYTRQLKLKIYTIRRLELSLVVDLISILPRHPNVHERRVKLWCLFDFVNSTLAQLRNCVICAITIFDTISHVWVKYLEQFLVIGYNLKE